MDFSHLLTKFDFPFPFLAKLATTLIKVFWGLVNTSEFPFMGPIGKLMREADISQGRTRTTAKAQGSHHFPYLGQVKAHLS